MHQVSCLGNFWKIVFHQYAVTERTQVFIYEFLFLFLLSLGPVLPSFLPFCLFCSASGQCCNLLMPIACLSPSCAS